MLNPPQVRPDVAFASPLRCTWQSRSTEALATTTQHKAGGESDAGLAGARHAVALLCARGAGVGSRSAGRADPERADHLWRMDTDLWASAVAVDHLRARS